MSEAPLANHPQPAAPPERKTALRVRPTAPIVPPGNVSGHALMLVIAIMAFLACLTLGAVSMVRSTAQSWQSQISREITIQIKPDEKLDMEKALADARDLALTFVGTNDGNIVDKAATARLLEPWLGEGLDIDDLPVPRLVIITIDEKNPPDFAAMRTMLKETIPQAYLDDHRTWVDRLVSMAHTTVADRHRRAGPRLFRHGADGHLRDAWNAVGQPAYCRGPAFRRSREPASSPPSFRNIS